MTQTIKLSDSNRRKIVAKLMEGKFDERWATLQAGYSTLAQRCYDRLYTPKERELIASLPSGWLKPRGHITVQFSPASEDHQDIRFDGDVRQRARAQSDTEKPFVWEDHGDYGGKCNVILEKTDQLSKEFFKLRATRVRLEADEQTLENEIVGILNSVGTTGKLIALWPEVETVVRSILPIERLNLPVPVRELGSLNRRLGLKAA